MERWPHAAGMLLALSLGLASPVFPSESQEGEALPSRVLYGGEISLNVAPRDPGAFNQTEYRRDSLRLFRLNFALEFRAARSLTFLTEIRSDNLDTPKPYALYARVHPFRDRSFDVQVGRIPPVFGAFARRRYESDNPLVGYPVPYQYPTVIRPDAAPRQLRELLSHRAYGARVTYPVGERRPMEGLAQVNPLRWDTGVQVKLGRDPLALAVAVTQGTISNPRTRDDNAGKQIAARLGWRPSFGSEIGFSASRGDYVADEVKDALSGVGPDAGPGSHQIAVGVDAEVARGSWLVRAEAIWTDWDVPSLSTGSLEALGFLVECRYKILPGLYGAVRVSGSRYETIDTPAGPVTWDAPLSRVEAGLGYSFHRHLLGKFSLQYNDRDGGAVRSRLIPAMQLSLWF